MKISPLTETTISTCVDNIDKAIESLVASRLDKSNLEASIHIAKNVIRTFILLIVLKHCKLLLKAPMK